MRRSAAGAIFLLFSLAPLLSSPAACEPSPALPPEAARAARDFLFAFASNDRDAISRLLPAEPGNLYGPCPFGRMPYIANPRADGRVGAVDFQGPMTDPALPKRGIIVLRLVEEDGLRAWRVRQIYWYDELPPEAEIPDKSRTDADRQQEQHVRRTAIDFIHFWLAADFPQMDRLTFHWWQVDRPPPKWVKMTSASVKARPTNLDGLRVDFTAKLRLVRLLPREVHGNLWLVKENGAWRVRPLTFALFF